ncbi:MAG TPA: hypothetical protein VLQ67_07165 [Arachnia sp.]|nr:hypothetical protein [Arachnia sp.]
MTLPSSGAFLTGSNFEGDDGNKVVDTEDGVDWNNVVVAATGIDQLSGGGDNSFGQGSKESMTSPTIVEGGIPPNKNDLTQFQVAYEMGTNDHVFLYLSWERLMNSGSANLDFEINKIFNEDWTEETRGTIDLGRSAGDLLVTYDFSGSGTPVIGLYVWTTTGTPTCAAGRGVPCWAGDGSLDPTEAIAGVDPNTGLFGEAAIDLTAAGVIPAGSCTAYGSAFVKSRSSGSSVDASLKDFIAPEEINLANCGSLTVKKVTTGQPAGLDQSFPFTAAKTSTAGTALSPATFSLGHNDTQAFTALQPGTYTATEGTLPSTLWTYGGYSCIGDNGFSPVSGSGTTATVALGLRQNVTCTFTNTFAKAAPTATTAQSLIPNDTFTLSGAFVPSGSTVPGGTVSFKLFGPGDATCAGTPALEANGLALTAGAGTTFTAGTTNTTFVATTEGTWRWVVAYTGDTYNNGVTKTCGVEQFTIDNDSTP